jgi:hypothetical protein
MRNAEVREFGMMRKCLKHASHYLSERTGAALVFRGQFEES